MFLGLFKGAFETPNTTFPCYGMGLVHMVPEYSRELPILDDLFREIFLTVPKLAGLDRIVS